MKDFVALALTCHITVDGEMYLNLSTKVHHSYLKKSLLENVLCYMIFNVSYHESTSLHKKSFDCASVKKFRFINESDVAPIVYDPSGIFLTPYQKNPYNLAGQ